MNYIEILLEAEKSSTNSLMWAHRGGNSVWISTTGYKVMEHQDLESKLLKAGCRYNFEYPLQEYTSDNGRTITSFNPPKTKAA